MDEYGEPLDFAVVELTNRCNLRCPHCASRSGKARESELTTEEWVPVFQDLAALGCREVTLLGGEVFLRPDWLELARTVVDLGMELALVTNGLLVKGKVAADLASLPLVRLGVSLDGAGPEVYRAVRGINGFDRVWRFIRSWQEQSTTPVNAITTFSRVNAGDVDNLARLIRGTGVAWQVQIAGRVSTRFDEDLFVTREQYRALCLRLGELTIAGGRELEIALMDDLGYFPLDPVQAPLHEWWQGCHAGRSVVGIRANGDVLGCLSLGDPFVEANLRNRGLVDVWRSPDSFRKMRGKCAEQLQGACRTCPEAERCLAGCAAMAFSATSDIYENPYCLRRMECEDVIAQLDL